MRVASLEWLLDFEIVSEHGPVLDGYNRQEGGRSIIVLGIVSPHHVVCGAASDGRASDVIRQPVSVVLESLISSEAGDGAIAHKAPYPAIILIP